MQIRVELVPRRFKYGWSGYFSEIHCNFHELIFSINKHSRGCFGPPGAGISKRVFRSIYFEGARNGCTTRADVLKRPRRDHAAQPRSIFEGPISRSHPYRGLPASLGALSGPNAILQAPRVPISKSLALGANFLFQVRSFAA